MKVVDTNVLLYAINPSSPQHYSSHTWLESALGGGDTVGLTWLTITGFVRISTNSGIFPDPLSPAEAFGFVEEWLSFPTVRVLEPLADHLGVMARLLEASGGVGNLVSDAHLAAIAVEHGASVVTYDSDLGRFPGVQWARPDDLI